MVGRVAIARGGGLLGARIDAASDEEVIFIVSLTIDKSVFKPSWHSIQYRLRRRVTLDVVKDGQLHELRPFLLPHMLQLQALKQALPIKEHQWLTIGRLVEEAAHLLNTLHVLLNKLNPWRLKRIVDEDVGQVERRSYLLFQLLDLQIKLANLVR